jgi:hypothetical protein
MPAWISLFLQAFFSKTGEGALGDALLEPSRQRSVVPQGSVKASFSTHGKIWLGMAYVGNFARHRFVV